MSFVSPLYKEGVTANAVTGDCFKSGNERQQSSASLHSAPPFQRRQPEYEGPLSKEGGAARIAVTGDCLESFPNSSLFLKAEHRGKTLAF